MLSHLLRPQIEADAAQTGERVLAALRFSRARNRVMWSVFGASTLLGFVVVLSSVVIATRRVPASSWIYVGIAVATLIVAVGEHFRTDLAFLNRQTLKAWVSVAKLRNWIKSDFLRPHTLTAYVLVVIPAVLSALLLAILSVDRVKPGSTNYTAFSDLLKQLTAFAGTLLAAQIALFNFMFGQLLGKYSSAIAVAVSKHRVVRVLRGYLLVLLVALLFFYLFGFPDALQMKTKWLGCFSESDMQDDLTKLRNMKFLKEAQISIEGTGEARSVNIHLRGNPIPISRVKVRGYGLLDGFLESDPPSFIIHVGDTYSRSATSNQRQLLADSFATSDRRVTVFSDVEITTQGQAQLEFSILAYPHDFVYIDGMQFDNSLLDE